MSTTCHCGRHTEAITPERLDEIRALYGRVAMEGEDRHHRGEPWPDIVSRQHAAIYELLKEIERHKP